MRCLAPELSSRGACVRTRVLLYLRTMNTHEPCTLGKIVSSNSHLDYVCRVFGRREADRLPLPEEYGAGAFVSIQLEEGGWAGGRIVGLIYDTLLLNPDFGSLGPRLSPTPDLKIVSPDLLDETAVLVGILAVGWCTPQGEWRQGFPEVAAAVNSTVQRLRDEEVAALHSDSSGRVSLRYAPLLLAQNNPIVMPLLMRIADRLQALFPAQARRITVLRNTLAWKNIVQPVG